MESGKIAVLGMPGYGLTVHSAALGFFRCSQTPDQVNYRYKEGSLLCHNFNSLWVTALNLAHRGEKISYFAMQHSDVSPPMFWLDGMIEELEARNLDVLSAIIPIPDEHGYTSLALERPDGDPWRPLCRLTMQEIYRLPATFTADDVGHPLWINTGLWVCKFDPAWNKKITFDDLNRIVFSTPQDAYVAEVQPEDWNFSQQLNRLGLRVGATRKIPVRHRGQVDVPNTHPWGDEFDSQWIGESLIPHPEPPEGFKFPVDVPGWLSEAEGIALAKLADGKRVLEIGSYCGRSTICIAQTADRVVSIDPHDGRATPMEIETYDHFNKNLLAYGVRHKVDEIIGTIDDYFELDNRERRFDLIFIDGAHDYESVKNDIEKSLELLAPGGLIAFHDYRDFPGQCDGGWDPGVNFAVDEFVASGASLLSRHDSLAVCRAPALVPLEA